MISQDSLVVKSNIIGSFDLAQKPKQDSISVSHGFDSDWFQFLFSFTHSRFRFTITETKTESRNVHPRESTSMWFQFLEKSF